MNRLMVILVIAFTLVLSEPCFVQGQYFVYVINDLGPKEKLQVHCRSKDDDLGPHTLGFGQEFSWKFDLNFLATTLFWCNLDSGIKHGSFEMFNGREDEFKCGDPWEGHCYRKVRKDGIYFSKHREVDYWKKYSCADEAEIQKIRQEINRLYSIKMVLKFGHGNYSVIF